MSDQVIENEDTEEVVEDTASVEDFLDEITPKGAIREWIVRDISEGAPLYERMYVQRPLSYFGKIEVFGLLGATVDKAMKDGMSIDSVMQVGDVFAGQANNMDSFIGGIARLAMYAPELLMELYCIGLGVPRGEREWVKSVWERPAAEGGLNDEDGLEILALFVEQNGEALRDFFTQKMPDVAKDLMTMFTDQAPAVASPSSKRSKPTRRNTRSR
jgi:hypothetical protein